MMLPFHSVTVVLLVTAVSSFHAYAQPADEARSYPSRPVRIVVGFTPGGQPDIVARLLAPKLYDAFGQQFVVDNRPGAGGVVGAKIVADATPDGHTLLSSSSSHTIAPVVHAKIPYDVVKDFSGVLMTTNASYVLAVAPMLNVKTIKELVALAKAKPGQLNFSSAGTGSGTHFAGEIFKQATQIDVVHVPYKGIPESLTDTVAGRVQFTTAPLGSSVALVRDGRLRGIAVLSAKRAAIHPDLPTVAESGYPGFNWNSWSSIVAPAKTPRAIINQLNQEITRILSEPEVLQRLAAIGMEAAPNTPQQLDQFIATQLAQIRALAQKAGIQPR